MKRLFWLVLPLLVAGFFLLHTGALGALFGGSSACVAGTSSSCGPVPVVGSAIADNIPGSPDPDDSTTTWRAYAIPLDGGCSQVGGPLAIQSAPLSTSGVKMTTGIVVAAALEECNGQYQAVVMEIDYPLVIPPQDVTVDYGLPVTRVAVQTLPAFTFNAKSADGNEYAQLGVTGPRGEWTYWWEVEAELPAGSSTPTLSSLTQSE